MQDTLLPEYGVEDNCYNKADEPADNCPERQDHTDKNKSEIKLQSGGNCWQNLFSVPGQFNPWDGNQADRFCENKTGYNRQQDIDSSECKADHTADGEYPPFPPFFFFV